MGIKPYSPVPVKAVCTLEKMIQDWYGFQLFRGIEKVNLESRMLVRMLRFDLQIVANGVRAPKTATWTQY
jgi:hypothetical protein